MKWRASSGRPWAAAEKQAKQSPHGDASLPSIRSSRRAYAPLTPAAFWLLVEAYTRSRQSST